MNIHLMRSARFAALIVGGVLMGGAACAQVLSGVWVEIAPPNPFGGQIVDVRFHVLRGGPFFGTESVRVEGDNVYISAAQDGFDFSPNPPQFTSTIEVGPLAPGTFTFFETVLASNGRPAYNGQDTVVVTVTADTTVGEVVEYYNATLDHYFITASGSDIAALDAHLFAGWTRTGEKFFANLGPVAGTSPVCRYYIPPALGDSHFFSAFSDECRVIEDSIALGGVYNYVRENVAAFYVALPDETGTCTPPRIPVYRLWNQRVDSNHRYTTSLTLRDSMLAKGYVSEGYGANGVAMCATPSS